MSKGHRDNHAARVKRGAVAFAKKTRRRTAKKRRCNLCGTASRPSTMLAGLCARCAERES